MFLSHALDMKHTQLAQCATLAMYLDNPIWEISTRDTPSLNRRFNDGAASSIKGSMFRFDHAYPGVLFCRTTKPALDDAADYNWWDDFTGRLQEILQDFGVPLCQITYETGNGQECLVRETNGRIWLKCTPEGHEYVGANEFASNKR
jgi:hypothetical protein